MKNTTVFSRKHLSNSYESSFDFMQFFALGVFSFLLSGGIFFSSSFANPTPSTDIDVPAQATANNTIFASEWNKMVTSFAKIKAWGLELSGGKLSIGGDVLVTEDTFSDFLTSNQTTLNTLVTGGGSSFFTQIGSKILYAAGGDDGSDNAEISLKTGTKSPWVMYHDAPSEEFRFWNVENLFTLTKEGNVKTNTMTLNVYPSIGDLPASSTEGTLAYVSGTGLVVFDGSTWTSGTAGADGTNGTNGTNGGPLTVNHIDYYADDATALQYCLDEGYTKVISKAYGQTSTATDLKKWNGNTWENKERDNSYTYCSVPSPGGGNYAFSTSYKDDCTSYYTCWNGSQQVRRQDGLSYSNSCVDDKLYYLLDGDYEDIEQNITSLTCG